MVTFVDINPADINTDRSGRRGRVSYPIIKAFMERNVKVSRLDDLPEDKNPAYLRSVLYSYINQHNLPIKVFSADGDLHLMRLDLNNDGSPNANWKAENVHTTEGNAGAERDLPALALNSAEITRRFEEEHSKSTK